MRLRFRPSRIDIASDRRVKLDAFSEKEYFASQTSSALPIQVLGYLVAVIMAIGSCFAVMNTMYAATAYRTREIATLRVLGYRRFSILVSFVFESVLLAVCGGIVGCLMALAGEWHHDGNDEFHVILGSRVSSFRSRRA